MLEVHALKKDSRVFLLKGPTYRFGMESQTNRNKAHIRQTISWMTSGRRIAHILCTRRTRIKPDGRVATAMSPFASDQKQLGEDGVALHSFSAGSLQDEPELIESEWF